MRADEIVGKYEKTILITLTSLMAIVALQAVLDLVWNLVKYILTPPILLVKIDQLIDIFGLFLLVLIGLELLDTIRTYGRERVLWVEIAIMAALLAIALKIIVLNYKELSSLTLTHIAAVVVGLAVAYYLLKLSREPCGKLKGSDGSPPEASPS